jgi:hypothetical protein
MKNNPLYIYNIMSNKYYISVYIVCIHKVQNGLKECVCVCIYGAELRTNNTVQHWKLLFFFVFQLEIILDHGK